MADMVRESTEQTTAGSPFSRGVTPEFGQRAALRPHFKLFEATYG